MTDLRLFDLNLLVAFDSLMGERNVTRAAQRIHIGQPAMSHALSRLRELFGDELFTRNAGSMLPTPKALELAGPIGEILADIRESIWAGRAFRPEAAEATFRLGATDYAEVAVLPDVLTAIRSTAPKVRVIVSTIEREWLGSMLTSGTIDLAIGYFSESVEPSGSEVLFHEEFDCLFDAAACEVTAPIALEDYAALPHLDMSHCKELTEGIEAALAFSGFARFVFLTTPHLLTIPFLLHGFRAVATVPRRLAKNCAAAAGLQISPMPLPMNGFDVSMHWHPRTDTDPAHRWFRQLVRDAALARAAHR